MSRPRSRARRKAKPPAAIPVPAWKRWLISLLFLAGGGAFAAWGVHDLVIWIRGLRSGAATIETASALLGIAPLGCGIALIGTPAIVSEQDGGWRRTLTNAILLSALVLGLGGVLLASAGGIAVRAIMRQHDYRVCHVWHGTRMSVTTWAAPDRPCPPEDE